MKWKIYLDRSKGYIGTINQTLIGILVLNTLPAKLGGVWVQDNPFVSYPIAIFGMFLFTMLIGLFDDRSGLRKEELKNMFVNDPLHTEMMRQVNNLHKLYVNCGYISPLKEYDDKTGN